MVFLVLSASIFANGIAAINIHKADVIGVFKVRSIVVNGKVYTSRQFADVTGMDFKIDSKLYSYENATSTVYFADNEFSFVNKGDTLYFINPREFQIEVSTKSRVMMESGTLDRTVQLPPMGGYLWNAAVADPGSFRFELGKDETAGTIKIYISMRLQKYDGVFDVTFILED